MCDDGLDHGDWRNGLHETSFFLSLQIKFLLHIKKKQLLSFQFLNILNRISYKNILVLRNIIIETKNELCLPAVMGKTEPSLRPLHYLWLDGEETTDRKSGSRKHRESRLRGLWLPECGGRGEGPCCWPPANWSSRKRVKYCLPAPVSSNTNKTFICSL